MLGGFWVGLLLGVNRLGVHDFEARVVVALSHELAGNKVHPVLRLVKHTENHVPIHFEADGDFKLLRHWFGLSLVAPVCRVPNIVRWFGSWSVWSGPDEAPLS